MELEIDTILENEKNTKVNYFHPTTITTELFKKVNIHVNHVNVRSLSLAWDMPFGTPQAASGL